MWKYCVIVTAFSLWCVAVPLDIRIVREVDITITNDSSSSSSEENNSTLATTTVESNTEAADEDVDMLCLLEWTATESQEDDPTTTIQPLKFEKRSASDEDLEVAAGSHIFCPKFKKRKTTPRPRYPNANRVENQLKTGTS